MIGVSVSGEDVVARGLGTLTSRLTDLSPAYADLGQRMEAEADPLVPVLTGALIDSLLVTVREEGLTYSSDLVYAGVQSGGWPAHNIEPSGFLDAAYDVAEVEGADAVEDLLTDTAARAGLI